MTDPSPLTSDSPATTEGRAPATAPRAAALCLLAGVVLYVLPTALHGNPPIEDAEATLRYVSGRSLWTIAHFANIAAVVLWAVAVALVSHSPALPRALTTATRTVWSVAAGVYAVYFGLHALGLATAASQFADVAGDPTAVLERTEALLLVLGSTAFVAQGLVGAAVGMLGLTMVRAAGRDRILPVIGIVIGAGWVTGAALLEFGLIVPCTALAWVWISWLAIRLLRHGQPTPTAVRRQPALTGERSS